MDRADVIRNRVVEVGLVTDEAEVERLVEFGQRLLEGGEFNPFDILEFHLAIGA